MNLTLCNNAVWIPPAFTVAQLHTTTALAQRVWMFLEDRVYFHEPTEEVIL